LVKKEAQSARSSAEMEANMIEMLRNYRAPIHPTTLKTLHELIFRTGVSTAKLTIVIKKS
jgi:hypothetical protein